MLYFFKAYYLDLGKRCHCLYKGNCNMKFPACEHLSLPLGTTLGSKRFMAAVGLLFLSLWLGEPYLSTQILQYLYKV